MGPVLSSETADVQRYDTHVRVVFSPSEHADFQWIWLRHQCPHERHPQTQERTLNPADVPVDAAPASLALEDGALVLRWRDVEDRPPSRYPLAWLKEHAYARNRVEPAPAASLSDVEVSLHAPGLLPSDWQARLKKHGVLVGRGGDADPQVTERLIDQIAAAGHPIVETHFGRIEDLRTDNTTNQNTDQLGYTDAPVDLHSDQPFLDHPPTYQLLHAMRAATTGGESLIADADAAARWLAAHDAETYATLTETPLRFHRKQKAFERLVVSPLLTRRPDGSHVVRSSYFTLDPFDVPFARVEGLYRALRRFERLIHTPAFLLRFLLSPGDLVIYDNHRMLHGRTGFSGPRWVRGVYFEPRAT